MAQPKVTAIRITQPMEDAIRHGKLRANGDIAIRGRAQTEDALILRGMAEAHDDYIRLTARGRYICSYILTGGKRRAWTEAELRDAEWVATSSAVGRTRSI